MRATQRPLLLLLRSLAVKAPNTKDFIYVQGQCLILWQAALA